MSKEDEEKISRLILMRHGQSIWNQNNLFTGWVDVPLTSKGIEEALNGGRIIKDIPIDIIFTSTLIRAQMTAFLAMSEHSSTRVPVMMHLGEGDLETWGEIYGEQAKKNIIPVYRAWELNERMYGALQGLNKSETAEKFGTDQVRIWRRSYDISPPSGESLEMTAARAIPYFEEKIDPCLEAGLNVLVAAHGNSLRAIIMHLENLSQEQILGLEIETGSPLIYEYRQGKFTKLS